MARDVKTPKRFYKAPTFELLDVNAAKAQLDAKTISTDEGARRMLAVIEKTGCRKEIRSSRAPLT